jgi:DNA repair exonuclease SbcCD ATPase subunit
MSKCPVCDTEYIEGQVDTCSICNWYLKNESSKLLPWGKQLNLLTGSLKQAEAWARDNWKHKQSQLSNDSKSYLQTTEEPSSTKAQEEEAQNQSKLQQQLIQNCEQLQVDLQNCHKKRENLEFQLKNVTQERAQLQSKFNESNSKHEEDIKNLLDQQQEIELKLKEQNSHNHIQMEELRSELQQKYQEDNERLQSEIERLSKLESDLVNLVMPSVEKEIEKKVQLQSSSQFSKQVNLSEEKKIDESRNNLKNQENNLSSSSPLAKTITPIVSQHSKQENPKSTRLIHPSSKEEELAISYNEDPKKFSTQNNVEVVSETEDSINQRRLGTSQAILTKDKRGNYWILTENGCEYMVPKDNFKINEYNYNTVQALFECLNYQASITSDFQLVKPAKVSFITGLEKWQLEDRGILQF